MAHTKRTNPAVKAIQTAMSKEATKGSKHARYEHNLSCYTAKDDPSRPGRHNYTQEEVKADYSRRFGGHCGATKRTHTCHPDGWEFTYVVVKRYKSGGWDFNGEGSGNQLIDEINCWNRLAETPDSDFLCPILKYFTSKSDKVEALDDKMKDNVVIIAQKAVWVDDLEGACREAERMNAREGFWGCPAEERMANLKDMAKRMGWRDVEWNPGNSGVIFDYAQGCYKAVFIDYAL